MLFHFLCTTLPTEDYVRCMSVGLVFGYNSTEKAKFEVDAKISRETPSSC